MMNKPPLLPSWLLLALLAAPAVMASPRTPLYPVSAIAQDDLRAQPVAGRPLSEVLASARMAYYDDTPTLRLVRDARPAGAPPVLVYMGGFTTNGADILWLEKEYRRGIAMVRVARLAHDLDATAREFTLAEPREGELAVVASTADGVDLDDPSRYCFWLRLDDELMKVTAVDSATGRVTVERGFDRSAPAAHRAGTAALGPVYLGNRDRPSVRFSASWPGASGRIRYAVEPSRPEAQAYKARCVIEVMRLGYDGAWWDTFRAEPINLCDALGRNLKSGNLWNPATGRPHDFASSLESLKTYTRNIRAIVRRETGRDPILYANSVASTYSLGAKGMINGPAEHSLLDGYCLEDAFLTPQTTSPDGRELRRSGASPQPPPVIYHPNTGKLWLRNVGILADAARSGLHVMGMSGAAGYLAGRLNSDQPEYARLLRYSYASFLLTVTAERSTSLGLPLAVQHGTGRPVTATPWPELLYAPLGDPTWPNDLAQLKLADSPCYARPFAGGYVVVNPGEPGETAEVKVPAGLVDAENGRSVGSVKLAPGDAIILVRAKS
jgi:hypothetical protein